MQYKSEGEEDLDNLSCHQTWEWKCQHYAEEKGAGYQYIIRVNQNNTAVTSAKRVAVLQASLKVVREEAVAQLSKKDNKCSASQVSKCL